MKEEVFNALWATAEDKQIALAPAGRRGAGKGSSGEADSPCHAGYDTMSSFHKCAICEACLVAYRDHLRELTGEADLRLAEVTGADHG